MRETEEGKYFPLSPSIFLFLPRLPSPSFLPPGGLSIPPFSPGPIVPLSLGPPKYRMEWGLNTRERGVILDDGGYEGEARKHEASVEDDRERGQVTACFLARIWWRRTELFSFSFSSILFFSFFPVGVREG